MVQSSVVPVTWRQVLFERYRLAGPQDGPVSQALIAVAREHGFWRGERAWLYRGQGISAMSTLALSAPLALASILLGAAFGLQYLVNGSVREAFFALRFAGR